MPRRYGILVAVSVVVLGVVVPVTAITSSGPNPILAGRFATGMGVESMIMIVPIYYNSEVTPSEVRGALASLQQLAIGFGIIVSFWIDYGTS